MPALKIISVGFVFYAALFALPRFSVKAGSSCNLCHIDPNGGSLRNDYGITLTSKDELPRYPGGRGVKDYTGIINEHLRVGGDIRLLNFNKENAAGDQLESAIFPMQADLYAAWQLDDKISIVVEQDLLRNHSDVWLIWTGLPGNGYLKAGKDLPAYGLNLDDHTAFIRGGNIRKQGLAQEGLIFSPDLLSPGIIEIGIEFGAFLFSQSVANQFINSSSRSGFGQNISDKAFNSRVEIRPDIGSIHSLMGISYLHEAQSRMLGIFWGIAINKFVWLGEVDLAEHVYANGTVLASYSALTYNIVQGCNVQIKFDFFDEDIDTTGAAIQRLSVGTEFFPVPFIELRCQIRFSEVTGNNVTIKPEYLIQLHTWF